MGFGREMDDGVKVRLGYAMKSKKEIEAIPDEANLKRITHYDTN